MLSDSARAGIGVIAYTRDIAQSWAGTRVARSCCRIVTWQIGTGTSAKTRSSRVTAIAKAERLSPRSKQACKQDWTASRQHVATRDRDSDQALMHADDGQVCEYQQGPGVQRTHCMQPLHKEEAMVAGELGLQVQVLAPPLTLFSAQHRGKLLRVEIIQLLGKPISWRWRILMHGKWRSHRSLGAGAGGQVLAADQAHGCLAPALGATAGGSLTPPARNPPYGRDIMSICFRLKVCACKGVGTGSYDGGVWPADCCQKIKMSISVHGQIGSLPPASAWNQQ